MSNNEQLLDELRRLHNDLSHGSDGGCFDICGLAGQAAKCIEQLEAENERLEGADIAMLDYQKRLAERDRQLEAAVRDMKIGASKLMCDICKHDAKCYEDDDFPCDFEWRKAGMEGEG